MTWEPDPMSHDFLPVAGHPDDDECTDREDGTDATYCGLPEAAHSIAEQCAACDTPLEDCPMPVAGCCDDCTHAANYGSTDREDGSAEPEPWAGHPDVPVPKAELQRLIAEDDERTAGR